MALHAPVARAAPRVALRASLRRTASAGPQRVLRAAGGCAASDAARRRMRLTRFPSRSKSWSYHDEDANYDDEPACDRPGHVFHPPRRASNGEEEADEAAAPLVLAPRHLYSDAHHSLDAMIAALEAERDALLLLKNDGWQADAWNTEEFAALRPGARSRWRVAGGGMAGRRGARCTLLRSRAADGAAGSIEFADGPCEQH